ncbi:MAG: DUF6580 family putative transport protein [Gammaproteobacteria bacterium]
MNVLKGKYVLLYGLIILAVLSRLVPHPANFTPVAALGVFAGAYLSDRRYWLIPLAAVLISDIFIGFYNPVAMLFVYLGFAVSAVIGRMLLLEKRNAILLGSSALVSAVVFFVFSNLGVWLAGLYYPMTMAGLVQCYVMAIPFFGNTLFGDIFYVVILFGIYEAVQILMLRQQGIRAV